MEILGFKPSPKEVRLTKDQPKYVHFFDIPPEKYTDEQLKEQLAIFEETIKKNPPDGKPNFDLEQAYKGKYKIKRELLHRSNSDAKAKYQAWKAIEERKNKEFEAWEKHILATEGEEAFRKKLYDGSAPKNIPEEMDVYIAMLQSEVDAGIRGNGMLEQAKKAREMGGIDEYWTLKDKEWLLKTKAELENELATNDTPEARSALGNIKLSMEFYGMDTDTKEAETNSSPPDTNTTG